MTKFSDQLLTDLMSEHGATLADTGPLAARGRQPRPVRRAALLAGGAGTLAAGLTVGLTAFGGGTSPAYAVTRHADGTLTVAVSQPSGVPGANQKLHTLGERVVLVPVRAGCPSIDSLPAPKTAVPGQPAGQQTGGKVAPAGQQSGSKIVTGPASGNVSSGGKITTGGKNGSGQPPAAASGSVSAQNKDGSVSVQTRNIPPGDLLVLAVSRTGHTTQMAGRLTSGPAPSCVSLPEHGPGGTVHTGQAPAPAVTRNHDGGQGQSRSDG